MNNSKDRQTIDKNLTDIINMQNIDAVLRTISDRCDLIENKVAFCKSLLDLAENEGLLQRHSAPLALGTFNSLLFTIDAILANASDKLTDYSTLLNYNFEKDRIDTIPYLIRQVVLYSDPERAHNGIVLNQADLQQYQELALDVIRKLAKKGKIPLNTTEDYAFIYLYWADFGNKSEISSYVRKHIKTANMAIGFMSQFLDKWSSLGKNDYYRGDFNDITYKTICKYIEPEYLYKLIVNDKRYTKYKGIGKDDIVSFEDHWNKDNMALAKVGKEHTTAFRIVIAQRFIHIFEHSVKEGELVDRSESPMTE